MRLRTVVSFAIIISAEDRSWFISAISVELLFDQAAFPIKILLFHESAALTTVSTTRSGILRKGEWPAEHVSVVT